MTRSGKVGAGRSARAKATRGSQRGPERVAETMPQASAEGKRGPGRPRGTVLTARIASLRLTPAERDAITAAAEASELSVQEWMRRAAGYCIAVRVPLAHFGVGPLPEGLPPVE